MRTSNSSVIGGLIVLGIYFVLGFGYVSNIVKLCYCDFASPYKAEVIRVVGIFMPPVGVVVGYLNLGE